MPSVENTSAGAIDGCGCLRRQGMSKLKIALLLLVLSLSDPALLSSDDRSVSLKLSPDQVRMGAFYNGTQMRLEGSAPPGSEVLAVIRGAAKPEVFNRKGRVGPIWLNTDKVQISRAPALFLSYSSADVRSLLDPAIVDQYQLDEKAIQAKMSCQVHWKCPPANAAQASKSVAPCAGVEPDLADGERLRASFIKLKTNQGTYQVMPRAVQLSRADGAAQYAIDLLWPRKAPPGKYQVEVYAIRDHAIVAQANTALDVVEVGFPAFMAKLSAFHPWFYGLLAVVAAVIAGFGIDAVAVRLRKPKPRPVPAKAPVPEPQPSQAEAAHVSEEEHVHH